MTAPITSNGPITTRLHHYAGHYSRRRPDCGTERGRRASTDQKSHIISLSHFLRTSQNIAIPTIRIHSLKYPQGNYVRNCWDQATHPRSQRAEPHISNQAPLVWRAPEGPAAVPVGGGGAWPGFETTRRAKLVARTARGRAAAHGRTKQPGPAGHTEQPGPAGSRVRQRGGHRSTRPLSAHSATASSRLRPNDPQSWRRRRIHRNMPPTTAAPRPAPPIRPSKPVRARPFFGLVAGTSGAT